MKHFVQAFVRKLAYIAAAALIAYLVTFCKTSLADQPSIITGYRTVGEGADKIASTALESCGLAVAAFNARLGLSFDYDVDKKSYGSWKCYAPASSKASNDWRYDTHSIETCPAGETGTTQGFCTGNISCTPPQVLNAAGTLCEDPPPLDCNSLKDTLDGQQYGYNAADSAFKSSLCVNGCTYGLGDQLQITSGRVYAVVKKGTGSTCSNPPPDSSAEAENEHTKCLKKGMTSGTVNGVVVCTPRGTPSTNPVSTNAASQTATTTGGSTTNTSTTTNTVNNGSTITTTTTTTNPDGSQEVKETTEDQAGFCEKNPNNKFCKPAADDICEADPTIPACQHWCDKPENADKLACIQQGSDLTDKFSDLGTKEVNFSIAPVSGIPSMAGCPVPEQVSIGPVTIPLSYEWLCSYAAAFRYLVLIFSWIGAAYIVYQAAVKD